jgi:hypothetical protein
VSKQNLAPALLSCVVLAVLLLLPETTGADGGSVDRPSYVALGDSIAEGAAATDNYGYVYRLRDSLAQIRGEVGLLNAAHGGFATPDVLAQLSHDHELRRALSSAELITLSIGGNHLLECAVENFTIVEQECVAAGIQLFTRDWELILERLRGEIGATGTLLTMTLFNPYTADDPNFAILELALSRFNDLIRDPNYRSTYDYGVVNVHDRFSGRAEDGTWRVCGWLGFCDTNRDPHPSNAGHEEIARLHLREYLGRVSYERWNGAEARRR